MKKLYFLLFTFLIAAMSFGQTIVFQENFEGVASFTTSMPQQTDGSYDYFTVTNGTTITPVYNSPEGTNFFAAQDLDADGMTQPSIIFFDDIDISTYSNLTFAILMAEAEASDGFEDWDNGDYFHIEYDIDNSGSFTNLIWVSNDGTTFNTAPQIDTDFNGIGDGTEVSSTFAEFYSAISGTGNVIDIRITFGGLTSSDEDFAIDNIRIVEGYVAAPTIAVVNGPASGSTVDLGPEDLSGELEFIVTNFNVDTQGNGGDGYIVWTVLNTTTATPHDSGGPLYDLTPDPFIPLEPNYSYYFVAQLISYATSNVVAEYDLNINTLGYNTETDLAGVRAGTEGLYYEVTGEVIITYIPDDNALNSRNQKYIQDSSGGILIDDPDGNISTPFNIGDGLTGLKGQLSSYNGLLQFIPTVDVASASSTGTNISPQEISASELFSNGENYESELIKVINITFTNAGGTFADNTNYNIVDGPTTTICRVAFGNEDLIGATIPAGISSVIGLGAQFGTDYQIQPRYLSDVEGAALGLEDISANDFKVYPNPTSLGYINISSKSQTALKVGVYDVLGKQVINQTINNNRLDVSNLTSGIYIMKISQDDASTTKKLIIK